MRFNHYKTVLSYIMFFLLANLVINISCKNSRNSKLDRDAETKGTLTISGAFAVYPLIADLSYRFQQSHPGIIIHVIPGSSGKGATDLSFNLTDIGLYSKRSTGLKNDKWYIKIARDAVVPIINPLHPDHKNIITKGLDKQSLGLIFSDTKELKWNQINGSKSNHQITVFNRSDACGATEIWTSFLEIDKTQLNGIGVYGDPGMVFSVSENPFAIGYVNLRYAYNTDTRKTTDRISVVPVDFDSDGILENNECFYETLDGVIQAINLGWVPSPPLRNLYLVTKQKPTDPLRIIFLEWLLTEGQAYIETNGYACLDTTTLIEELKKIR